MLNLIAVFAFAAITLTAWGLLRPKPSVAALRMRTGPVGSPSTAYRLEAGLMPRVFEPAMQRTGRWLASLLPSVLVRELDQLLTMARSRLTVAEFVAMWLASLLVGLAFLAALIRAGAGANQALLLIAVIAPVFGSGPIVWLRRRVAGRQARIRRALPDAFDLLVTGVEAGLSIDASIAAVAERTVGPLSDSFHLYLHEVGLGSPRRSALMEVAERTGVDDFVNFAGSVAQAEEVGTNLGDVLRRQANDVRAQRWQRAQEAAQRAPVLMTIPLALFFLPAMVAVVIVPSIMTVVEYISKLGAG